MPSAATQKRSLLSSPRAPHDTATVQLTVPTRCPTHTRPSGETRFASEGKSAKYFLPPCESLSAAVAIVE